MNLAQQIYNQPPHQRHQTILAQANLTQSMSELQKSQKISNFIDTFIDDYFKILINNDQQRSEGSVLQPKNFKIELKKKLRPFLSTVKAEMQNISTINQTPKNIYELSGAIKLSSANNITRSLSTKLGLLWEVVANISPYSISPEIEFSGLKLVGIDLISKNKLTNIVEYHQLKTQKNTLTGSQRTRAVQELSTYQNPVFCACFELNNWTFRDQYIPRVAGINFWSRIGIDYVIFEAYTVILFKLLDREFTKL